MSDSSNFLKELEVFVKEYKDNPEKRFATVSVNDYVVFIKRDEKDKENNLKPINEQLYNFGLAQVIGVKNVKGVIVDVLPTHEINSVLVQSESYPFNMSLKVNEILRNYTAEERKNAKKETNE